MTDRLEEIKQRVHFYTSQYREEADILRMDWLITEVERLREVLRETLPLLEQRAENLYGCTGEGNDCYCADEAEAITLRNKVRALAATEREEG